MKVYVVLADDDYGYKNVLGVYRDATKAEKFARDLEQNSLSDVDVEEHELE